MSKKQYICGECGCVFEDKDVIVNLKERLGKDSFKSLLQKPLKGLSEMMGKDVCPECGSDKVMEIEENVEMKLPEFMSTGWDSSLLSEYFEPTEENAVASEEKSGVKDFIRKSTGYFNDKVSYFKEKYNPSDLMKKIGGVAKKVGASTVYHVLLLYYALMSSEVPTSKKVIIMAALGYFITPLDFIPDFIPLGLIDDSSVLLYAINQIMPYINEEMKLKALSKLREWFGKTDIISIKSQLLPTIDTKEAKTIIEEVELDDNGEVIEAEIVADWKFNDSKDIVGNSNHKVKNQYQKRNNMELFVPYEEVNDYVDKRFNQPITLSFKSKKEFNVSYTKRVIIPFNVNIDIKIEEVDSDSILLAYNGSMLGLDSIISGAISFVTRKFPELSAGIHPEDDHQIRICLSEIEKAKAVVENIALNEIIPEEEGLRIRFSLKVPS